MMELTTNSNDSPVVVTTAESTAAPQIDVSPPDVLGMIRSTLSFVEASTNDFISSIGIHGNDKDIEANCNDEEEGQEAQWVDNIDEDCENERSGEQCGTESDRSTGSPTSTPPPTTPPIVLHHNSNKEQPKPSKRRSLFGRRSTINDSKAIVSKTEVKSIDVNDGIIDEASKKDINIESTSAARSKNLSKSGITNFFSKNRVDKQMNIDTTKVEQASVENKDESLLDVPVKVLEIPEVDTVTGKKELEVKESNSATDEIDETSPQTLPEIVSPNSLTPISCRNSKKIKKAGEKAFAARRSLDRELSMDTGSTSILCGIPGLSKITQSTFAQATESRHIIEELMSEDSNDENVRRKQISKQVLDRQLQEASDKGQLSVKKAQEQRQDQKNNMTTVNDDHAGRARYYLEFILDGVDEYISDKADAGLVDTSPTKGLLNGTPEDLSTLGFDNTVNSIDRQANIDAAIGKDDVAETQDTNCIPSATCVKGADVFSMSSLNEILDGSTDSPSKMNSTELAGIDDKNTNTSCVLPDTDVLSNIQDETKTRKNAKGKRFFGKMFSNSKSSTSTIKKELPLKNSQAVSHVIKPSSEVTQVSKIATALTTTGSVFGSRKVTTKVSSMIVEEKELDSQPSPSVYDKMRLRDEDIASTVEERLQEKLLAFVTTDNKDFDTLASIHGVKFHTKDQMEKERELLSTQLYSDDSTTEKKKNDNEEVVADVPSIVRRRRVINSMPPSFVSAPKGESALLAKKSFESFTQNEIAAAALLCRNNNAENLSQQPDDDDRVDPSEMEFHSESVTNRDLDSQVDDVSTEEGTATTFSEKNEIERDSACEQEISKETTTQSDETDKEMEEELHYGSILADPCSFCESFWITSANDKTSQPVEVKLSSSDVNVKSVPSNPESTTVNNGDVNVPLVHDSTTEPTVNRSSSRIVKDLSIEEAENQNVVGQDRVNDNQVVCFDSKRDAPSLETSNNETQLDDNDSSTAEKVAPIKKKSFRDIFSKKKIETPMTNIPPENQPTETRHMEQLDSNTDAKKCADSIDEEYENAAMTGEAPQKPIASKKPFSKQFKSKPVAVISRKASVGKPDTIESELKIQNLTKETRQQQISSWKLFGKKGSVSKLENQVSNKQLDSAHKHADMINTTQSPADTDDSGSATSVDNITVEETGKNYKSSARSI